LTRRVHASGRESRRRLEDARGGPRRTPGTRLRWEGLAGWLEAWAQLGERRARAPRFAAERAHLEALELEDLERCDELQVLAELAELLRGDRARRALGHDELERTLGLDPVHRLRSWVGDRLARLRRGGPDLGAELAAFELERLERLEPVSTSVNREGTDAS